MAFLLIYKEELGHLHLLVKAKLQLLEEKEDKQLILRMFSDC